jgi:threonine/homoserine/homoserine lactone efflux protein
MTFAETAALLGTMLVLAFTPGIGVVTVTARTLAGGIAHGLAATLGMILGDIVFILLAVSGLSLLAERYIFVLDLLNSGGAAYLLWLGVQLWRTSPVRSADRSDAAATDSLFSSLLTGLLITFGNPKAILFYVSFLPAFIDLRAVTLLDTSIIILSATLAVGSAMTTYTLLTHHAASRIRPRSRLLPRLAAAALILIALALFTRALR